VAMIHNEGMSFNELRDKKTLYQAKSMHYELFQDQA